MQGSNIPTLEGLAKSGVLVHRFQPRTFLTNVAYYPAAVEGRWSGATDGWTTGVG
jgi:hypothetical protein